MTMPSGWKNDPERNNRSNNNTSKKSGAGGALAFALVIGMIMIMVGFAGMILTDPFSDPTGWIVLIVLGFVLVIGGFLYATLAIGTSAKRV